MCEAGQRPGTAGGGSQGGDCVLEIACQGSYTSVGASLGTGSECRAEDAGMQVAREMRFAAGWSRKRRLGARSQTQWG